MSRKPWALSLALFLASFGTTARSQPANAPTSAADIARPVTGSHYQRRSEGAKTVIVFVHGVLGDAVGTWRNGAAYWPALMAGDPDFSGSDIYVFQYPTSMWANLSINELAENMRLYLTGQGVTDHDNIVFLAHSMGGLVVRAYLLKYRSIAEKTGFIYFFSTPTQGSQVASLATFLSSNPQFSKMPSQRSQDYLADVQRDWLAARFKIPSYCAYETRTTYGLPIVPQASAGGLCTERLDPIDADHLDIVKPKDRDDVPYMAFKAAFREQTVFKARPPARTPDAAVKVNIDAPQTDASFPVDYRIVFRGRAFDPESGDLEDADLRWATSEGLPVGTGRFVPFGSLPPGRHRVVLTATTKSGREAKASVDIDVKRAGTSLQPSSSFRLPGRCGAVAIEGRRLAVTSVEDLDPAAQALFLFDVADERAPRLMSRVPFPFPSRVLFRGSVLYAASASGSLRIFETAGGTLDEAAPPYSARRELGAILEAASAGSTLALRGLTGATEVLDVSDPKVPRHHSWFASQNQGGLGFYKENLLVPARYAGFEVRGPLTGAAPPLRAHLDGKTEEFSTNVEVSGDFAYVGSWAGNMKALYLANPSDPKVTGSLAGTGNAFRIALDRDKLFLAGLGDGLQVLDVSIPSSPRYDAAFYQLGRVADVAVREGLLAVCADKGFSLLRRTEGEALAGR